MTAVLKFANVFARNRSGATAVEYGLICALIVIVLLVGLHAFADSTTSMWGTVDGAITTP